MFSQKRKRASGAQLFFLTSLALLFIVVSTGIGYTLFTEVREAVASSNMLPDFFQTTEATPEPGETSVELQRWEGNERINVLLLGIDERENVDGPWRTDTMIVLTIDPVNKTGGMLSIPRDLWVPIPGYDNRRINQANYLGDAYDYPGGGPALAARTVEYNLGVPIHYYVRVNFQAFIEIVDRIGGIDVYVEEEIDDPLYPSSDPDDPHGYDPFYIPAGLQHMDGELALKYARTRHTAGGDFDRAARQQQVMRAILDKVTRLELLPQLLPQIPEMWSTLNDSVETNLTLDQIVSLAHLATEVPGENIRSAVIGGPPYTEFYETPDGQQVLYPVREHIRELVDYVFTTDVTTVSREDPPELRLEEESAVIEVQNGTTIPGLAQSTAEFLYTQGISVTRYTNADLSDYEESLIYVHNSKNFSAETIARMLNLPQSAIIPVANPNAEVDIIVILGADYELPDSQP
jgi:LCP family protein required for cell wall assembly